MTTDLITGEWMRVSSKQIIVQLAGRLAWLAVIVGATVFAGWRWPVWWVWATGGTLAACLLVGAALVPRQVRAIGYRLRDDDLLYRRGILWQRYVAVPYGRMQLVDVTRGPVQRWLGLSSLTLHTAAAVTSLEIEGLEATVADELRDKLVALAETRRAGL